MLCSLATCETTRDVHFPVTVIKIYSSTGITLLVRWGCLRSKSRTNPNTDFSSPVKQLYPRIISIQYQLFIRCFINQQNTYISNHRHKWKNCSKTNPFLCRKFWMISVHLSMNQTSLYDFDHDKIFRSNWSLDLTNSYTLGHFYLEIIFLFSTAIWWLDSIPIYC